MKMVTALIKPFKLDDVHEALIEIGITGITIFRNAEGLVVKKVILNYIGSGVRR